MTVKFFSGVLLVILAGSTLLHADTFLKYKRTTDPYTIGGQSHPASTSQSTAWIGAKKAAYDDGEGHRTIMAFGTRTLTVIDIANKTYSVLNLDSLESMFDQAIEKNTDDAESAAAMKAMMQGIMGSAMKGAMKVTATGEKKKIGSWMCTKYLADITVAVGVTKSEMWITDQIKVDPAIFNMMKNGMMAMLPGFGDIAKEIEKIKGVPVQTVSTAQTMGANIVTTELLLESAEKAAPAGIYTIPKGYAKQSIGGE
jgi:hypothetical protein